MSIPSSLARCSARLFPLLAVITLAIAGCSPAAATAVPSAVPTPAPSAATAAPSPTATPKPAALPSATASPTATPAPKPAVWQVYSNANYVRAMATTTDRIYAATEGGVAAWDPATGALVKKWTTADGLSHNLATSAVACPVPQPGIVVGTERGLSLLDLSTGKWTRMTRADSGMAADEVAALLCDAKNGVLVVAYDSSGIDIFDSKAGAWRHVGEKQGLASDYVNAIAISPDGKDIWVASPFGATLISGQTAKVYDAKATKLASDGVSGIAVDAAGNVWWGMMEGLARFSKGAFKLINDKTVAGFPSDTITSIAPAPDGTLWAGTGFGDLCHLDATAQKCLPLKAPPPSGAGLNALAVDSRGLLYYATDGDGFLRYDGSAWRPFKAPSEPLASNRVSAIGQEKGGAIWIATANGANRVASAGAGAAWETITASDQGLPDNVVAALQPSAGGGMWLAAGAPALLEAGKWTTLIAVQGLLPDAVTAMALDSKGRVWLGTPAGINIWDGKKLQSLLKKDGLPDDRIQALLAEGDIMWAGTPSGLLRFDGKQWQAFTELQGLPSPDTTALARSADGSLLVGTAGGLATFDGKQAKLVAEVVQDFITSISVGKNGNVWVGTMAGAYRGAGGRWQLFTVADGLPTNRIMAVFVDATGGVWVGGDGAGVAVLRP